MQVTKRMHALKIQFKIPVSPEMTVDRFAFVYLIFGDKIYLIDSGVAGAESAIREYILKQGREPKEVSSLILTHSHPDHLGAAGSIKNQQNIMDLYKKVVGELGLPPFAVNPLVAKAFASSLAAEQNQQSAHLNA